jgi:hypothetical protein
LSVVRAHLHAVAILLRTTSHPSHHRHGFARHPSAVYSSHERIEHVCNWHPQQTSGSGRSDRDSHFVSRIDLVHSTGQWPICHGSSRTFNERIGIRKIAPLARLALSLAPATILTNSHQIFRSGEDRRDTTPNVTREALWPSRMSWFLWGSSISRRQQKNALSRRQHMRIRSHG